MGPQESFSVCQFFDDGRYEYVRRDVTAEEAMKAAEHYCTSLAARMGLVERVIITDGGDCCCFEWRRDTGVTFPPKSG